MAESQTPEQTLCDSLEVLATRLSEQIDKVDIEEFFDKELHISKSVVWLWLKFAADCSAKTGQETRTRLEETEDKAVLERIKQAQKKLEEIANDADARIAKHYESRINEDFEEVDLWFDIFLRYCKLGQYIKARKKRYTLIITTRYYGCYFCDTHVMEIFENKKEFENRDCHIIVIAKGTKEGGGAWKEQKGIDFPTFSDDRKMFVAKFGFKRNAYSVNNLMFCTNYVDVANCGAEPYALDFERDSLVDITQLGGDMLVCNKTCSVLYDHRCSSPSDRPAAGELLRKMEAKEEEGEMAEEDVEGVEVETKSKMCLLL